MTLLFCSKASSAEDAAPPARRLMPGAGLVAGLFLALLAAAPAAMAAAQESTPTPVPSPLQQALQTDMMLQQLGAPRSGSSAVEPVTTHTAALAATTQTLAATTQTLAQPALRRPPQGPPRLTTATVTLRPRPALPRPQLPPFLAATSATLSPYVVPAGDPALNRLLVLPEAYRGSLGTSASQPVINPAWLGVVAPAESVLPPGAVRINAAGEQELRTKLKLDGIRARNIVWFRTHYGPFKTPDDLAQVSGINEEMIKKWDDQNLLFFK